MKTPLAQRIKTKSDANKKAPAKPKSNVAELPRSYTVRDMGRHTRELLQAARQYGQVEIRERGGATFLVTFNRLAEERKQASEEFLERHRQYREKMRASGFQPGTQEDADVLQRMIAGEA